MTMDEIRSDATHALSGSLKKHMMQNAEKEMQTRHAFGMMRTSTEKKIRHAARKISIRLCGRKPIRTPKDTAIAFPP